jgi:hypothetical protein
MPESTRGARVRVNMSTTSKGIPSFDCTVELSAESQSDVAEIRATALLLETEALERSDHVYAELKKRYGAQQQG